MKLKRGILLILILVSLSSIVLADCQEDGTGCSPSDADYWNNADNFQSATPEQVAEGLNSGHFPEDKLGQLKAEQLEGNLHKIKDTNQMKKLDQTEFNKALKNEPYGFQGDVDLGSLPSNSKFNSGYKLDLGDGNLIDSSTPVSGFKFGSDGAVEMATVEYSEGDLLSELEGPTTETPETQEGGYNLEHYVEPKEGTGGDIKTKGNNMQISGNDNGNIKITHIRRINIYSS